MTIYKKIFDKSGFSKSQQKILDLVGTNKQILEIGSSTGYMTQAFKKNGCVVDVVEIDKNAGQQTKKYAKVVINSSIEDLNLKNSLKGNYDFIIMADVIEHLVNPEVALKNLYQISSNKTKLIISTPNIACWLMRKQLFFYGDFEYEESGLLDKTHLHFFTVKTLPKVLRINNWETVDLIGTIITFPFQNKLNKIPVVGPLVSNIIGKYLASEYKNFSFYHFIVVASRI